jgi:cell division protein FtsQ
MRDRRQLLIVGSAVALAVTLMWGLTFTSLFSARTISVEGASALSTTEVASLAGVSSETNVWHLDARGAEAALLADPWVAEAAVMRDLPRTLLIRITERTPVAVDEGGEVVAGDGTVLPGAVRSGLPSILGALDRASRSAAAAVVDGLAPAVQLRLASVNVAREGEVVLELRDGITVGFGAPTDASEKGEALRAVLRWAADEGVRLRAVNVTVPNAPTATLDDGTSLAP